MNAFTAIPFAMSDQAPICLSPDLVLALLTELGKYRALADHETDIVEAIVCRGHRAKGIRIRWTAKLDRQLLRAGASSGGIKRFAASNELSPKAAYDRLHKLRKAKRTGDGVKG